jgi:hypothetical protein
MSIVPTCSNADATRVAAFSVASSMMVQEPPIGTEELRSGGSAGRVLHGSIWQPHLAKQTAGRETELGVTRPTADASFQVVSAGSVLPRQPPHRRTGPLQVPVPSGVATPSAVGPFS